MCARSPSPSPSDARRPHRRSLAWWMKTGGRQIFDRALFVSRALHVTRRALPGTAGSRRDIVRRPAIRNMRCRAPPYRKPKISPQGVQRTLIGAGMSSRIVTSGDAHDAHYPICAAATLLLIIDRATQIWSFGAAGTGTSEFRWASVLASGQATTETDPTSSGHSGRPRLAPSRSADVHRHGVSQSRPCSIRYR